MENEKRLIKVCDATRVHNGIALYMAENAYLNDTALDVLKMVATWIEEAPVVDAYTEEQVACILQQVKRLEINNQELETEYEWLKSCLNCKIRRECPRHCGKVVHGCDHWVYGDSMVHGRWEKAEYNGFLRCSECKDVYVADEWVEDGKWNYCPNCGAKMDGGVDNG